jgi:hypothetical protein
VVIFLHRGGIALVIAPQEGHERAKLVRSERLVAFTPDDRIAAEVAARGAKAAYDARFTKVGGGGYGGSTLAFRYRSSIVSFDPAAPYYNVHLGLKEALELVEAGE